MARTFSYVNFVSFMSLSRTLLRTPFISSLLFLFHSKFFSAVDHQQDTYPFMRALTLIIQQCIANMHHIPFFVVVAKKAKTKFFDFSSVQ
jgi:hypothetical protein